MMHDATTFDASMFEATISDATPFDAALLKPAPTARRWVCAICGFVYDEALGMPLEGIEPGTAWDDVPDSWTCPDCGVRKCDFDMVLVSDESRHG